jgi:hypothetical protein
LKLHIVEIFSILCLAELMYSTKETGFLPNLCTQTKYCRQKPGFWALA